MYILFYSKKCKYSDHFIKILQDAKEDKFFKMASIDKIKGKRPDYVQKYKITEVPTIVVDSKKYCGTDAFKWLEKRIKNMKSSINSQSTRTNKTKLNIVSGFAPDDFYSPLDGDTYTNGSSNYCSLNFVAQNKIPTPEEGTEVEKSNFILPNDNITGGGATIKDKLPDKQTQVEQDFEKIKLERNMQDSKLKPRLT